MADIKNLVFVSVFVLAAFTGVGQNKKIDKLEMLYNQQNYEIVYRRAKRYLNKPEYDKYPEPAFYKAISLIKFVEEGNGRFTYEESLIAYREFLGKQPDARFLERHKTEIAGYEESLTNIASQLAAKGDRKGSERLLSSINTLFNTEYQYADVIKSPGKTKPASPTTIAATTIRDSIIDYCQQFMGVPYKWGGMDPSGFDCSGFTKYVMSNNGYEIPRVAGDQYESAKKIDLKKADKGDLVFFGTKRDIVHVGIVVSEPGQPLTMIHASSSKGIMVSNIEESSYWKSRLLFAARVIN